MRPALLLAPLTVAACLATPTLPPCACVVVPEVDGALNMSFQGRAVTFEEGAQTSLEGGMDEAGLVVLTGFDVDVVARLDPAAPGTWAGAERFSVTQSAGPEVLRYSAGPGEIALRIREAVPQTGGFRVRGDYRGTLCRSADGGTPTCGPVNGTFAFDEPGPLPVGLTPS